jgi:hypothetical protein
LIIHPPHVHAFGADFRLKLAIPDARVLEAQGTIGPAVLRRLQGWIMSHRDQLGKIWTDASRGNPIGKIED